MKAHEVMSLVNGSAFKPGWRPVARYVSVNQVELSFDIDTVDTSYPDEQGGYPVPKKLPAFPGTGRVIDTSQVTTEEEVAYELLKLAAEINSHEEREFLRFRQPGGRWHAPLHPHTLEGELSWQLLKRERAYA